MELYLKGELDVDPLISHQLALDEVNRGFELMEAQDGIRSVISVLVAEPSLAGVSTTAANASTTRGSNWVPAQRRSSARAPSSLIGVGR